MTGKNCQRLPTRIKRPAAIFALCCAGVGLVAMTPLRHYAIAAIQTVKGKKTVADRVEQYGEAVRTRLAPEFMAAGVAYPPRRLTLVGLKEERKLEVWVAGQNGNWRLLKTYPILGMSGKLGPKLKEGDRQVPEGMYRIESINPNSLYHLSIRVNYPNAFDLARANKDGRTTLGSDIMIHGKRASIGCLAMGDEAAEELFVLAAETGLENISVVLSPVDFRTRDLPADMPGVPPWTKTLYHEIKMQLGALTVGALDR